jgi:hypothetical protein
MQHAEPAGLEEPAWARTTSPSWSRPACSSVPIDTTLSYWRPTSRKSASTTSSERFEPAMLDLGAQPVDLLGRGVEPGDFRAVELLRMEHETAEAAADVDHRFAGGDAHLPADVLDLVALRFLDAAVPSRQ